MQKQVHNTGVRVWQGRKLGIGGCGCAEASTQHRGAGVQKQAHNTVVALAYLASSSRAPAGVSFRAQRSVRYLSMRANVRNVNDTVRFGRGSTDDGRAGGVHGIGPEGHGWILSDGG